MRLRSMIIFGAGYLCGTRAGRDRYKQIAESVRGLAESDVVRSYVDRAMDVAKRPLATVVPEGTEAATDVTERLTAGEDVEEDTSSRKSKRAAAGGG